MARNTLLTAILGIVILGSAAADDETKPAPKAEVVFVLDTTGSMGGLIEAAKKKIWSIANEILKGNPRPELRVGLVAYRDKGDAYVTQVTPLTRDLDHVYGVLLGFQAQGGGDEPENVRQALHDAVTKISWTEGRSALKVIFLVGDCPPHLDYADVPKVEELCLNAVKAGIVINTIRCGGNAETGRIWRDIALRSEGTYASIDQDGGVVAIATPFDEEIGKLSDRLGALTLTYGDERARRDLERKEAAATAAPAATKADRAKAKSLSGYADEADFLGAVASGSADPGKMKDEELPAEIRGKSPEERQAWIEEKIKERQAIQAQMDELSKKRDGFLAEELKKSGSKDAFDAVVTEAIHKQAADKGIHYGAK